MANMNANNHLSQYEVHTYIYEEFKCTEHISTYSSSTTFTKRLTWQVNRHLHTYISLIQSLNRTKKLTSTYQALPNLRRLFVDARTEAEESKYSRNAVGIPMICKNHTIQFSLSRWLTAGPVLQPDFVYVLSCRLQSCGAANECGESNGWTLIDSYIQRHYICTANSIDSVEMFSLSTVNMGRNNITQLVFGGLFAALGIILTSSA